eukprot:8485051-Alexandrium_andersonii.AAC.1
MTCRPTASSKDGPAEQGSVCAAFRARPHRGQTAACTRQPTLSCLKPESGLAFVFAAALGGATWWLGDASFARAPR